jgi:osmotically-inducible protein OsmY
MKLGKTKFIHAMLVCGLATAALFVPDVRAPDAISTAAAEAAANAPVVTTDRSQTLEHDRVRTSARHFYSSPAERAKDDLLITEVKSSLAERGISEEYPVAVDCDHGTIELSGVVRSADAARQAALIAYNIKGVVAVKNKLTWR